MVLVCCRREQPPRGTAPPAWLVRPPGASEEMPPNIFSSRGATHGACWPRGGRRAEFALRPVVGAPSASPLHLRTSFVSLFLPCSSLFPPGPGGGRLLAPSSLFGLIGLAAEVTCFLAAAATRGEILQFPRVGLATRRLRPALCYANSLPLLLPSSWPRQPPPPSIAFSLRRAMQQPRKSLSEKHLTRSPPRPSPFLFSDSVFAFARFACVWDRGTRGFVCPLPGWLNVRALTQGTRFVLEINHVFAF